ncbi:LysR family transcriptional regulator [Lysinibacillus xylanilyticus]|uniref:LysR family transcriptional regulator n=1 Tax=Lysinibacillus xylanilyticus TaxID=582475 RepID=UPI002E25104F|nr:LysR family transcriptional regulator [Lysinibacillus xylanilyticus]
MEIRQLEYFLVLCNELHFTKAAEKLNITQPTLSHQIKVLENELGIPLFDRLGKKIAITDAGKILHEQCTHIFRAIDNTSNQIIELKELKAGKLAIGTLPGELTNLVSNYLLDYHLEYPDLQICINSSDDLLKQFKDNKIDFAISYKQEYFDYEDEQLQIIPLFTEELLFVAHSEHPLLASDKIAFQDVLGLPLILFPTIHQCRKVIDSAARNEKLHVKPKIETASVQAIFKLVEQNVGATIISKTLCDLYKTNTIREQTIYNPPLTREIVLLYRKDKFINFAAKAFIRLMVEGLEEAGFSISEKSQQLIQSLIKYA